MRRHRLEELAMTLAVAAALGLVAFLVVYPMVRCGFWTAFLLGRSAWLGLLTGVCG